MAKYEYKISSGSYHSNYMREYDGFIHQEGEDRLNDLARDGWELAMPLWGGSAWQFILRRPVVEPSPETWDQS